MTTYVYETIPTRQGEQPRRFEHRQSMLAPALTQHPETGEPVRRLILGGFGFISSGERQECPDGGYCENPSGPSASCCCASGSCNH